MHFRSTIVLATSMLLTSSLALAQAAPADCTDATKTDATKKADKKAETKKKDKKAKGEAGSAATTTHGKKGENKDSDLDKTVGQTTTTSAEQPPKADVAESRAEEVRRVEGKRWSVAPLVGYGTADLKVGLGARAGYTFETPIYVGGTFLYHFGNGTVDAVNGVSTAERRFYYPAGEVGYDISAGPLLFRPYAGVGVLFAKTELTVNGITDSATDKQLMIYPGATAQYLFPRSPIFVGADARVLLPLEGENPSFSMFATAGLSM